MYALAEALRFDRRPLVGLFALACCVLVGVASAETVVQVTTRTTATSVDWSQDGQSWEPMYTAGNPGFDWIVDDEVLTDGLPVVFRIDGGTNYLSLAALGTDYDWFGIDRRATLSWDSFDGVYYGEAGEAHAGDGLAITEVETTTTPFQPAIPEPLMVWMLLASSPLLMRRPSRLVALPLPVRPSGRRSWSAAGLR